MSWRTVIVLPVTVLLVAACDITRVFGPTGGPYPAACDDLGFSDRRCAAIVERARANSGIDPASVASIVILPPGSDGTVSLGGQRIARVRFDLTGGAERTEELWCAGVGSQDDLACANDPVLGIVAGVDHDVPCAGEPPDGCATPPPTPHPAIQAQARPLRVTTLDIPLDHLGMYEVVVGKAGLPDGVLSRRSATLADPRPGTFWIVGGIRLEVRPDLADRPPIGNIYRDPFDGVEPVTVVLLFEVTETTPGAVLQVREIVVE